MLKGEKLDIVECALGGEKPKPLLAREKDCMLSLMAFPNDPDRGGGEKNRGGGGEDA